MLEEEENKKGATILFSSHILSEVQRLCNRVAIIKEGKIVTVEELKYWTPFKYFEAKNIMFGGGLAAIFVVLSIVLIAALSMVTYVFYKKRDLNV